MRIKIEGIDHIVLTVNNLRETIDFYSSILGMKEETFGTGRKALSFGLQKFNLHEKGKEFEPRAKQATPGAIDICLISSTPMDEIIGFLTSKNIPIEDGPVVRTGASGEIISVYIRDPDNNLIEISNPNE
jgi:catechol 2,3-dioxygenase-like lactoylglutathione lyase family enzyme